MSPTVESVGTVEPAEGGRVSGTRERAEAALARHAPGAGPLAHVGDGVDHDVFRAGDLVLRVGDPGSVRREAALLRALASVGLPCPVPEPRFVDEVEGVLGLGWLPGAPLLGRVAPPGLAATLGEMLRRLHAVDVAARVGLEVPAEGDDLSEHVRGLAGPVALLATVRTTVPEPGPHRVLVHNDLGAEHLLVADGRLTGVIDWSDAAISDPAVDFARLLRDFGPAFLDDAVTSYGGAPDEGFRDRVLFLARCAALEDLAYGAATGRRAYATAARASLGWLFRAR